MKKGWVVLISYLGISIYSYLIGQDIIGTSVVYNMHISNLSNCSIRQKCDQIDFSNVPLDVTIAPNGDIWMKQSTGLIRRIDTLCNELETFIDLRIRPRHDGLVADARGNLWLLGNQVIKIDTRTLNYDVRNFHPNGSSTNIVPFFGCGTYHQRLNKIYHINDRGAIFETDTNDIRNSTWVAQCDRCSLTNKAQAFTYVRNSCREEKIYITIGSSDWYEIDIFTGVTQFVCRDSALIVGGASFWHILPGDCRLRLDLDIGDLSGTGVDRKQSLTCNNWQGGQMSLFEDVGEVELFSERDEVDSIQIELSGIVDSGMERLVWDPSWNVRTRGSLLTLSLPSKDESDYLDFLRSLQYENRACLYSKGQRMISFIIYDQNEQSSAIYYLDITHDGISAGEDESIELCADDLPFAIVFDSCTTQDGRWQPEFSGVGEIDPQRDTSGRYMYIVGDDSCRLDTAIYNVIITPLPSFDLGPDTMVCMDFEIGWSQDTIGLNFEWSDGFLSNSRRISQSGEYVLTARTARGCSYTDSIVVEFLDVDTLTEEFNICEGDTLLWMGREYYANGTYGVASDDCQAFHELLLSVEIPPGNLLQDTLIYCDDTNPTICLSGYNRYEWSTGSRDSCADIINSQTIHVEVESENGCVSIDSSHILVSPVWHNFNIDTLMEYGSEIGIDSDHNPGLTDEYVIVNGDTIRPLPWEGPVLESLKIIHCVQYFERCEQCRTLNVRLEQGDVFLPNTFSPNGDNINDVWTIFAENGIRVLRCAIFTRWGEMVHEYVSNGISKEHLIWDGQLNGRRLPAGVYTYILELEDASGERQSFSGSITLMK